MNDEARGGGAAAPRRPAPLWAAAWAAWLGAELALSLPLPRLAAPVAGRLAPALDASSALFLLAAFLGWRSRPPGPARGGEGGALARGAVSAQALLLVAAAFLARGEAVLAAQAGAFPPGGVASLAGWIAEAAPAAGGAIAVLRGRDERGRPVSVSAYLPERLLPAHGPPRRGEAWRLEGRLVPEPAARNPGGFDARTYYAARGVAWEMEVERAEPSDRPRAPIAVRLSAWLSEELARGFDRALAPDLAALAKSLALGERGALPPAARAEWRWAGAAHVLAVSGMHVSVLAGAVLALAGALPGAAWRVVPPVVWLYVLVVGAPPSALRAGLMLTAAALARLWGRPAHALSALGLSALLLLFARPALALDVGFRLSFLATAGVVLWTEPLARRVAKAGLPVAIAAPLAVGVAASGATVPASLAAFGWVAWWSPLSGLALVPLADLALPLGLLGAALVACGAPDAALWPAAVVLRALAGLAAAWADVGRSLPPLPAELVPAAGAGLAFAVALGRLSWRKPLVPRRVLALGLAAAMAAGWLAWTAGRPAARALEVTFLDVGEGDAALVRTPSGRVLVVDGGDARLGPEPSPEERPGALADLLAYRRVRRVDVVVATHPDADHFHGLVPVVETWPVGVALYSGRAADGGAWSRFAAALAAQRAPLLPAHAGMGFRLPDGVRVDVLNPPALPGPTPHPDNDLGVVLRVAYGRVSFLFAADIEAPAEEWLARSGLCLQSTVLKVPHHGSRTSSTRDFLRAVDPALAVLSVGPNNYGLPDEEVLLRYRDLGIPVLRTDEGGAVILRTDSERLWLLRGAGRPSRPPLAPHAWAAPACGPEGGAAARPAPGPATGDPAVRRESGAGTGGAA